jgi:hypothetical protein
MATMRTDADIKVWEHLKGRKVCVSESGLHVGTLAARYGATEKVYKAPADSLLALRVGSRSGPRTSSRSILQLSLYEREPGVRAHSGFSGVVLVDEHLHRPFAWQVPYRGTIDPLATDSAS